MGVPGQSYLPGRTSTRGRRGGVTRMRSSGISIDVSSLLQQGVPASDVLYFYGENVPSFVRLKGDDPAGVLPGYDYDVINAEALIERTRVEEGKIVLPDGTSIEVLVLPAGNSYGLAALEHIAALVDGGARVVGEKPTRPIGLSRTPQEEHVLRTWRIGCGLRWPMEERVDCGNAGARGRRRRAWGRILIIRPMAGTLTMAVRLNWITSTGGRAKATFISSRIAATSGRERRRRFE